jgi:hypothetical protein
MGIGSDAAAAAVLATPDGASAAGAGAGASLWRSVLMQRVSDELGAAAVTGLSNEAGEYNCFLNVIIQCLWRCADFRRQASAHQAGSMGRYLPEQAIARAAAL